LAFGDGDTVRTLDLKTGRAISKREFKPGLGVQQSFIAKDILVGNLAPEFHAIDLRDMRVLWAVPKLAGTLVSDGNVVIWPEDDVVALDLLSGREQWRRTKGELGGHVSRSACAWEGWFIVVTGAQLTALDLKTGRTVWRWKVPSFFHWWHPYDGRAYFFLDGVYAIVDLKEGKLLLECALGPAVPEPLRLKKKGLTAGTKGVPPEHWRDVRVVVSETHTFLQNASGQIVALKRDTGEIEQVVEIDAMPTGAEPVIYENRLLLTDFNAAVHCFEAATVGPQGRGATRRHGA
jgi:hypothetical protein